LVQKAMAMSEDDFEIIVLTQVAIWVFEVDKNVDELVVVLFLLFEVHISYKLILS